MAEIFHLNDPLFWWLFVGFYAAALKIREIRSEPTDGTKILVFLAFVMFIISLTRALFMD